MKQKNRKRFFIAGLIIVVIFVISNWVVINTPIASFTIFKPSSLFGYFGVLIGFSLTIYTFGLSMVSDIKLNIEKIDKFDKKEKENMYSKLIRGFSEIKQDIWIIFWSIILVVIFAIANEIVNPLEWKVEKFKIPETVFVTLFITTMISMFDIMKTLFNLSEINLELIKNSKESK